MRSKGVESKAMLSQNGGICNRIGSSGCSLVVAGTSFNFCGSCDDVTSSCPHGVPSKSDYDFGAGLTLPVACENPGHPTFPTCMLPIVGVCNGRARLGYNTSWSNWKDVQGTFSCSNSNFGGDPIGGQATMCVCEAATPTTTTTTPQQWNKDEKNHIEKFAKDVQKEFSKDLKTAVGKLVAGKDGRNGGDPEYLGCYRDDGDRDLCCGLRDTLNNFTVATCQQECLKFEFFSLQYGGQCFCDNEYGTPEVKYGKKSDEKCGGELGGSWANAVYRV